MDKLLPRARRKRELGMRDNVYGVSFLGSIDSVLELDCGDGYITVNTLKTTDCTL